MANWFQTIANDPKIIAIYDQISRFEDEDQGLAHHNYDHVMNVSLLMQSLLTNLGYMPDFIDEAMVAGILHDTGSINGKAGHAHRSYEFARQYFFNHNITLQNEFLILDAIKNHSEGFDTDNIIALTLILSDKLDIKYTRVAKAGYTIIGMRQLQYIRDVNVKIENFSLVINFICDPELNLKELEEFYFTRKVFKAIYAFADKTKLTPKVMINHTPWLVPNK